MIIVKLTGGLGNQMFQYATGRRLAEKHSTILKLDVSGFEVYKLHRYSLHCFHIWEYLATQNEVTQVLTGLNQAQGHVSRLTKWKRKLLAMLLQQKRHSPYYIDEKYFQFDATILDAPNPVILEGYWQTEKYFADISDILRREFVVKYTSDPASQRFAAMIQHTNAVSLHVRRADYVQNQITNQIHGTCDQAYYEQCVQYIAARVSDPHFFIFSDEPEWARENLNLHFPTTIVDCNDASRNYEDLRLMSLCQHNIIANSSFSWWGAWLNGNPDKIVCAPKQWFKDNSRNTQDLIPSSWIQY
jgi:hypothetical protein